MALHDHREFVEWRPLSTKQATLLMVFSDKYYLVPSNSLGTLGS